MTTNNNINTTTTANVSATDLAAAAPGSTFGILDKVGKEERRAIWTKNEEGVWYVHVPTHTFLAAMPETRTAARVLASLQFAEKVSGASVAFELLIP